MNERERRIKVSAEVNMFANISGKWEDLSMVHLHTLSIGFLLAASSWINSRSIKTLRFISG